MTKLPQSGALRAKLPPRGGLLWPPPSLASGTSSVAKPEDLVRITHRLNWAGVPHAEIDGFFVSVLSSFVSVASNFHADHCRSQHAPLPTSLMTAPWRVHQLLGLLQCQKCFEANLLLFGSSLTACAYLCVFFNFFDPSKLDHSEWRAMRKPSHLIPVG